MPQRVQTDALQGVIGSKLLAAGQQTLYQNTPQYVAMWAALAQTAVQRSIQVPRLVKRFHFASLWTRLRAQPLSAARKLF